MGSWCARHRRGSGSNERRGPRFGHGGSVFVNPVPGEVAAGQLIDGCGLRGFRIGSAEVSTKHANFIQADVDGNAADVLAVMSHVRRVVADKTGHVMRSEVRLVGFEGPL
ncbi:MAG: hypothetical protein EBX99_02725 [Acidimicrobiia bacterium]|nr:hypothetical protein [Acidimicrobiia bacterium]